MGHAARVAERELKSAHLLEVTGDLDVSNASPFVEMLFAAVDRPDCRIVVDLDRADFIDSTILNALYTAARRLRERGGKLAIVCTKDHLFRVLEATGLEGSFPIVESVDAAVAAVR
jgi:anti-sigma B factor antagonist